MDNYDPGQQPQYNSNPAPVQQMQDYSYLYNNQSIIQQQQQSSNNTIQIAQANMQQHMATVLQGTMAAGMAIYSGGNAVISKGKEMQYNDMNFGNGKFVLERSFGRDVAWGMGIAQSDFGRALKIGGRKPEFLTGGEYEYQMSRSTRLRGEELEDMALGGAMSLGGMAMAGVIGGPWGIAASIVAQPLADFATGGLLAKRRHARDFRHFTETTDTGRGRQRIGEYESGELAGRFFKHDYSIMEETFGTTRFKPNTDYTKLSKDMMTSGLLKDINLNDVDALEMEVKKTAKFIEKFAGILKMTKDEVLKLKASFKDLEVSESGQTDLFNQFGKIGYATGMSGQQIGAYAQSFMSSGIVSGYSGTKSASEGLSTVAAYDALQRYGIISKAFGDPGTLAVQAQAGAQAFGKSAPGMVFGMGGTPEAARQKLIEMGGGSLVKGFLEQKMGLSEKPYSGEDSIKNLLSEQMKRDPDTGLLKGLGYLQQAGVINDADAKRWYTKMLGGIDEDKLVKREAAKAKAKSLGLKDNSLGFDSFKYDESVSGLQSNTYSRSAHELVGNTVARLRDTNLPSDGSDDFFNLKRFMKSKGVAEDLGNWSKALQAGDKTGAETIQKKLAEKAANGIGGGEGYSDKEEFLYQALKTSENYNSDRFFSSKRGYTTLDNRNRLFTIESGDIKPFLQRKEIASRDATEVNFSGKVTSAQALQAIQAYERGDIKGDPHNLIKWLQSTGADVDPSTFKYTGKDNQTKYSLETAMAALGSVVKSDKKLLSWESEQSRKIDNFADSLHARTGADKEVIKRSYETLTQFRNYLSGYDENDKLKGYQAFLASGKDKKETLMEAVRTLNLGLAGDAKNIVETLSKPNVAIGEFNAATGFLKTGLQLMTPEEEKANTQEKRAESHDAALASLTAACNALAKVLGGGVPKTAPVDPRK